jgi:hypothetical protein
MLSKKENNRAILETLDQVPPHSCYINTTCCKKKAIKKRKQLLTRFAAFML